MSCLCPGKEAEMVSDDFIAVSGVTETAVFDTSLLVFRDGMSKRRQPEPTERVPYLPELGEKGLRLLQVLGIEALGEPTIEWCEEIAGLSAPALLTPEPGEARCRTQ